MEILQYLESIQEKIESTFEEAASDLEEFAEEKIEAAGEFYHQEISRVIAPILDSILGKATHCQTGISKAVSRISQTQPVDHPSPVNGLLGLVEKICRTVKEVVSPITVIVQSASEVYESSLTFQTDPMENEISLFQNSPFINLVVVQNPTQSPFTDPQGDERPSPFYDSFPILLGIFLSFVCVFPNTHSDLTRPLPFDIFEILIFNAFKTSTLEGEEIEYLFPEQPEPLEPVNEIFEKVRFSSKDLLQDSVAPGNDLLPLFIFYGGCLYRENDLIPRVSPRRLESKEKNREFTPTGSFLNRSFVVPLFQEATVVFPVEKPSRKTVSFASFTSPEEEEKEEVPVFRLVSEAETLDDSLPFFGIRRNVKENSFALPLLKNGKYLGEIEKTDFSDPQITWDPRFSPIPSFLLPQFVTPKTNAVREEMALIRFLKDQNAEHKVIASRKSSDSSHHQGEDGFSGRHHHKGSGNGNPQDPKEDVEEIEEIDFSPSQ